jgi:hypothetical protein
MGSRHEPLGIVLPKQVILGVSRGRSASLPGGLTYPLEAARQKRSLRCWGRDVIASRPSFIRMHFLHRHRLRTTKTNMMVR